MSAPTPEEKKLQQALKAEAIKSQGKPTDDKLKKILKEAKKK